MSARRIRLILALTAILPVFVMLGWFLAYRDEARGRELEDARQILGIAADRVEASIAPTAPLESILSEEISNSEHCEIERIDGIVRKAFEHLIPTAWDPRSFRVSLFTEAGEPYSWPPDEDPLTGGAIWKGVIEQSRKNGVEEDATPDPAVMASASAALPAWLGQGMNLAELEGASYFSLVRPDKSGRPTAVAVYRALLEKTRVHYTFGIIIRVPLDAIPASSYHSWAGISRPSDEDAAGIGILDPSGGAWLLRAGRLPELPIRDLLKRPDHVLPVPGGFAVLRDLPAHAPGKLVLFRPESFWTGGGLGIRVALGILVCMAAAFSWLLAGFLAGPGGVSDPKTAGVAATRSLRTRTALVFLFAGMVPVGFSILQGGMRLYSLETVRRVEWEMEAERVMTSLDRGFRDTLERYQEHFTDVVRNIAGKPLGKIPPSAVGAASCSEIISIEAAPPGSDGRQEAFVRSTEGRRLIMSPLLHRVMKDVFLEMRSAAGRPGISRGGGGKERIALPLHEMVGDVVPLKELFNRLGHVTYITLAEKTALLFCRLYALRGDPLAGMLVGGTTLGLDSSEYFDRTAGPERWKYPDWELFRINKTIVDPKLAVIPREFLRLSVRTQQTGAAAAARVGFPEGTCLVRTSRPSYLRLGVLAARIPVDRLKKESAWLLALAGAGVLIALGLAVGVAVYLSRRLLEPIRMLQKAAESVGEGTLDVDLPFRGTDELGRLGASFLEMTDGLRQRERMRRFLSESAWAGTESETAGDAGAGVYIEAALLSSDIRNFTGISEKEHPTAVTAMLNEYFTAMDSVIRSFGGEIDKFVGDAILAVFKTAPGLEHPAGRAVRAGLAMRRRLAGINEARRLRGEFLIENGVGIHVGRMISGKVGAAAGRQDFTVIGPVVTAAAKLEAASRSGRHSKVVVSAETAEAVAAEFACVPLEGDVPGGDRMFEVVGDHIGYTGGTA